MSPIPEGGIVAVTGAAGFIGSWIVTLLLEQGFSVRACVRDADGDKAKFLRDMIQCKTRRLTLHSCDINVPGVFDGIFDGAHGVMHVADALMSGEYSADKHPEMAVKAVMELVASTNKSGSVNRFIYTSSVAAVLHEQDLDEFVRRPVIHDRRYPDYKVSAYQANPRANGYALAKIACEKAVTDAAAASGDRWDAMITNPGDNFGPMLSAHHMKGGGGIFNNYVSRLVQGKDVKLLSNYHPMWPVDVRDDAQGHINLLTSAQVSNGDRFLMLNTQKLLMEELVPKMRGLFPALDAAGFAPTAAATDAEAENVRKQRAYYERVWAAIQLRNDGATSVLGVCFRDFQATLRDTVESLVAVCGIEPKMAMKSML